MAALLLDASPDGLLLVDSAGQIRLANRSAERIFGYAVDELLDMNVDELVPSESRRSHAQRRQSFAERPSRRPMGTGLQLHGQQRDGETFPVEVSLSPLTIDGAVQTVVAVRDVSDRREVEARLALAADRERIAHDLHDLVIQRVFAVGMSLQSVVGLVESPVVRDRIASATDELDETIRSLRSAIFHLGSANTYRGLTAHLAELIDERAHHLGFTPDLNVVGKVDDVPDFVADQLIATLTEALSNVLRHAHATAASVLITRADGELRLEVADNGTGISVEPKPLGGLSNMMWRAAELGGSCTVAPSEASGTRLVWQVPT